MRKVIHPDQTGFIGGRQLPYNLRRLFNVIYSPKNNTNPEILISLDAHKAFDRIKYVYLLATLRRFGLAPYSVLGSKFYILGLKHPFEQII